MTADDLLASPSPASSAADVFVDARTGTPAPNPTPTPATPAGPPRASEGGATLVAPASPKAAHRSELKPPTSATPTSHLAASADLEKQPPAPDDGSPRRGAPKRPEEYALKGATLAFGAPLPDGGCINPAKPSWWQMWRIPGPLSLHTRQGWYFIIFHIIGAIIISAAANFGVACAMYRKHSIDNITMWKLKDNTIAGDMAVTILIQTTATYVITSTMVHRDIYTGLIAPLRRPWPYLLHLPSTPSPNGTKFLGTRLPSQVPAGEKLPMGPSVTSETGPFKAFCLWFLRFLFCGTERNDILAPAISFKQRCQRFLWTVVQGLGLSALVVWAPFWGISLCIVAPIWTGHQMAGTWVGPAIKCTYGGILALVTNPFICLIAMGAEYNVKRAYPELQLWQDDELAPINRQTVGLSPSLTPAPEDQTQDTD